MSLSNICNSKSMEYFKDTGMCNDVLTLVKAYYGTANDEFLVLEHVVENVNVFLDPHVLENLDFDPCSHQCGPWCPKHYASQRLWFSRQNFATITDENKHEYDCSQWPIPFVCCSRKSNILTQTKSLDNIMHRTIRFTLDAGLLTVNDTNNLLQFATQAELVKPGQPLKVNLQKVIREYTTKVNC